MQAQTQEAPQAFLPNMGNRLQEKLPLLVPNPPPQASPSNPAPSPCHLALTFSVLAARASIGQGKPPFWCHLLIAWPKHASQHTFAIPTIGAAATVLVEGQIRIGLPVYSSKLEWFLRIFVYSAVAFLNISAWYLILLATISIQTFFKSSVYNPIFHFYSPLPFCFSVFAAQVVGTFHLQAPANPKGNISSRMETQNCSIALLARHLSIICIHAYVHVPHTYTVRFGLP